MRLKGNRGFQSFTDEQAALLGYVKAPDCWVKVVYKFPLRLRVASFFYRWWVRIRYGVRSGHMWWAQDDPDQLVESMEIGWTGDTPQAPEFVPPSIGTPPPAAKGVSAAMFPAELAPDPMAAQEGEESLQRYMALAERWQAPLLKEKPKRGPTKKGGPERPNPHLKDGPPGGMAGRA